MKKPVRFRLNGEVQEVLVDTRQTLLEVLRDVLYYTGTKEGCGNGNCGACTVIVDGRTVNACLMLGVETQDCAVETIEGLAVGGELHPIQQAFLDHGGLQCGFCTPGFLMSTRALLARQAHPSEEDIRLYLSGNLCRCTGYDKIVRAVMAAAQQMA
jgi:carbon-monoxide dehydrogenase small subunit